MDRTLYEDINGYAAGNGFLAHFAEFLAVDAIYLLVVVLGFLALAPGRWTGDRGRPAFISAGLSAALALGLAQVVSHLVARPRPFVAEPAHSHVLVDSARDFTLPSDHATAGFAIATAIALRMPRLGVVLLGLVAAISVSRVAVGVHYPGDVLAGAALGAACAGLLWLPVTRSRIDELTETASRVIETRLARLRNVPATRRARRSGP
jgi:undecaprenyl-diphosphatase